LRFSRKARKRITMETQTTIEYEIIDSQTNVRFFTYSRDEALDNHARMNMVYERHFTITNPSQYTQSHMLVIRAWHNNPEFEKEEYNGD
jgi:hypothetical protein